MNLNLVACRCCGRSFADDRIEKHESICKTVTKKKRRTFDTKKQRQATDGAGDGYFGDAPVYGKRNKKKQQTVAKEESIAPMNSNWRQESEAFRAAIREARSLGPMPSMGGIGLD